MLGFSKWKQRVTRLCTILGWFLYSCGSQKCAWGSWGIIDTFLAEA